MRDVHGGNAVGVRSVDGGDGDDLAGRMGGELRRIDADEVAGVVGVLHAAQEGGDARVWEAVKLLMIGARRWYIRQQFVTAQVIERLKIGAVLVAGPGDELIEGVPQFIGLMIGIPDRMSGFVGAVERARFRKDLVAGTDGVEDVRILRFVGDCAVPVVDVASRKDCLDIAVGLLVALQVIPAREDEAARLVDDGAEVAAWRVVEQAQVAAVGVHAPDAADGGGGFILVDLRIEPLGAVAGAVAGEDDAIIGAVDRRDIVEVRRLRNFHHRDGFILSEPTHFIDLKMDRGVIVLDGSAHDHAEERLRAGPMDARFTHGNLVCAGRAVAGLQRQVAKRPVIIAYIQIPAAGCAAGASTVVAEDGKDGREVIGMGRLRDEHHRI